MSKANATPKSPAEKIFSRNIWMFSLGTIGRDFLFNFFNGYLLTFILLTKNLTPAQFGSISAIIIAARVFDALNDPIMGGIVESTRSKFGKYKPWQLIGAVSTSVVIVLLFNLPLYGWAFIAFLAVCYFLFSITFTMNDISYWGMMPSLTSDAHNRNKLNSFANVCAGIGGGAAGFLVPIFTTGSVGTALFGSATKAFGVIAIATAVMMVGFQMFTIFGVVEPKMTMPDVKKKRMKFKDVFKAILKNDQLLWAAICLLLFNIGTNPYTGGLSLMYTYFEFGYDGLLTVLFTFGAGLVGLLFVILFPSLCKKQGRTKVLFISTALAICGYLAVMFVGLFVKNGKTYDLNILGFEFHFSLKFLFFTLANMATGFNGMYTVQTINMANSVEYNELKTGKREESLVFSLRPLANKLGSAIAQGIVSLVYIIAGVLTYTNQISDIENAYSGASLTAEQGAQKLTEIKDVIQSVPENNKKILLICMCLIPIAFLIIGLILYKRFFKLDEKRMLEINAILEERHKKEAEENATL